MAAFLDYVIPADAPPSFDAHRETTFATMHSAAPFYSVLIRVDPNNPSSTTDFVCDLCTANAAADRRRQDLHLQDPPAASNSTTAHRSPQQTCGELGAHHSPARRRIEPRESHYVMVDTVDAPDPTTVVFHLKFATNAFLPALGDPYSWIYQKEILDRDPRWYEKNILARARSNCAYEIGSRSRGSRTPIITMRGCLISTGLPASMPKSRRCGSTRSRRPRGDRVPRLPPAVRDELVGALGDKITVQTSDLDCGSFVEPTTRKSRSTNAGYAAH